jgi:ADP-heptose:LPS heptosyltransferase
MSGASRILVIRTDRLGDVLMSLPALELLREAMPESAIDLCVRPSLAEVLGPYLDSRRLGILPFDARGEWRDSVARRGYGAAIVLFDEPGVARALWRAGIAVRVGAYSKPRSFFFLNTGRRQRRARAERNEAEYNLDLVRAALRRLRPGFTGSLPAPIRLPENTVASAQAERVLRELGIGVAERFVVVHPGMGGSALNWEPAGYLAAIGQLERAGAGSIVLSLGPSPLDRRLGTALRAARPDLRVLEGQSLAVLGEVFRRAIAVIAPSTGPLHLAHYVGTTTLGIYSPVRAHQPRRWAPWGGTGRSLVWVPEVVCGATKHCQGSKCPSFNCMEVMAGGGLPSGWVGDLTIRSGA